MMNFTEHFLTEIKLTLLALIGLGAWVADASQSLNLQGWDEVGLKGILLAAVFFIGKLFLQSQRDHKAEMAETWKLHKEESTAREERMCTALDKHAVSLERIAELNEEQLQHFRGFVKGAIDDKMRPHG